MSCGNNSVKLNGMIKWAVHKNSCSNSEKLFKPEYTLYYISKPRDNGLLTAVRERTLAA